MKMTVERDAFSAAIDATYRAARNGPDIPVLKNILLTPFDDAIEVQATNLSMSACATVPAEIDGGGEGITVMGEALDRIVGLFPLGSQVTIEWADDQPGAHITCGRSRYRLHTLPASDFPEFAAQEDAVRFTLPAKDLADALSRAQFAMETHKGGRIYLRGIYMHVDDSTHPAFGGSKKKHLLFVATNGGEFARIALPMPVGADKAPGIIIPDDAVDHIIRHCRQTEGDVTLSVSNKLLGIETSHISFVTKLVDGTYPDFKRPIEQQYDGIVRLDCKVLLQALARMTTLGKPIASATFNSDPCELRLVAHSHERGDADEAIEIEWAGEETDFGVKIAGLENCVKSANADVCALHISREGKMTLMHPVRNGEVDYSATFMSMKLEA